mmetsp:Transcript_9780/g.24373  ORF Transcript_9780/g.24373 Transcript_9780/m.24373 type:complete len:267 (+) Transcript_9780:332-1132(+)
MKGAPQPCTLHHPLADHPRSPGRASHARLRAAHCAAARLHVHHALLLHRLPGHALHLATRAQTQRPPACARASWPRPLGCPRLCPQPAPRPPQHAPAAASAAAPTPCAPRCAARTARSGSPQTQGAWRLSALLLAAAPAPRRDGWPRLLPSGASMHLRTATAPPIPAGARQSAAAARAPPPGGPLAQRCRAGSRRPSCSAARPRLRAPARPPRPRAPPQPQGTAACSRHARARLAARPTQPALPQPQCRPAQPQSGAGRSGTRWTR